MAYTCEQPSRKHPTGRRGTTAGYQAHQKLREPACDECRAAQRNRASQSNAVRKEYRAAYYQANLAAHADRNLSRHGVTREWYDATLKQQGGGCAICGTTDPKGKSGRRFYLDHDHACCPTINSCGECARGLLCAPCNMGLGAYGDDPARLRAAAAYLERGGPASTEEPLGAGADPVDTEALCA